MAPASRPNGSDAPENGIDSLLPDEADLLYEEELLRNPYSLRMWVRYLDARKSAPTLKRRLLYERALEKLPGSYKVLWRGMMPRMRGTWGQERWAVVLSRVAGVLAVLPRCRENAVPCMYHSRSEAHL